MHRMAGITWSTGIVPLHTLNVVKSGRPIFLHLFTSVHICSRWVILDSIEREAQFVGDLEISAVSPAVALHMRCTTISTNQGQCILFAHPLDCRMPINLTNQDLIWPTYLSTSQPQSTLQGLENQKYVLESLLTLCREALGVLFKTLDKLQTLEEMTLHSPK